MVKKDDLYYKDPKYMIPQRGGTQRLSLAFVSSGMLDFQ